jgi:hypothetical protein
MAKGPTPEQKFKKLFDLSNDEATTQAERDAAQGKWREWLKRHDKKPIDISAILAQAERDDAAAKPSSQPPPDPRAGKPHPFDDPKYDPASLIENLVSRYLAMTNMVRVVYTLWIVATHIHAEFRVAPRVLLTSDEPEAGKTTALEIARCLMFRANEESFATAAAIRDHLDPGPGSIALDEGDLYEPAARRALLLLWNLGHTQGAKCAMLVAGRKKLSSLFAPMIAAGLGRILGQAQLSRTLVLRMNQYDTSAAPEFNWWAPSSAGPDSAEARKEELDTIYAYLRHCAATWKLNRQPPMPSGIVRRAADNFRSLLAVSDMCGGEWPRRAREAIVALANEMNVEQPKVLILRHGLMLFDHFEVDWLEIHRFNRELRALGASEHDWSRYRGASGLDGSPHAITISEQGRLLTMSGVRSRTMWAPDTPRAYRKPGDCRRVYRRPEFEEALRRNTRDENKTPALRLIKPSAG